MTFPKPLLYVMFLWAAVAVSQSANAQCYPFMAHDSLQLVTNNAVYCSETKGDTVFIGGKFTYIGKYTGGLVHVNYNGQVSMPGHKPRVVGSVYTMIPDDNGGYFIGGNFTHIGDSNRANIAQIDASGNVLPFKVDIHFDNWNSQSAFVNTLIKKGDKLYIGGKFRYVNDRTRNSTACIDLRTRALTSWHPYLTSSAPVVNKMLMHNDTIYIGGLFYGTKYDTTSLNGLVAVDTNLGLYTDWRPNVNSEVKDMYLDGDTLYIGARDKALAYDLNSKQKTLFDVNLIAGQMVYTICVWGQKVYIGGVFSSVNGISKLNAAAFDKNTGLLSNWNPAPDKGVYCIKVKDNRLYMGGVFNTVLSSSRKSIALLDSFGNLDPLQIPANPIAAKGVCNFYFENNRMFIGGDINSVGGKIRTHLAAYNGKTSEILDFAPKVTLNANKNLWVLKRDNQRLYIGGGFSAIDDKPTANVGVYNIAGDSIENWNISSMNYGSEVKAIAVANGKVYIGGIFSTVSGLTRVNLFCADSATAAIQNWTLNAGGDVYCMENSGKAIYFGGRFTTLNGQASARVAAIDLSGNLLPWRPNPGVTEANAIKFGGGAIYISDKANGGVYKYDTTTSNTAAPLLNWNGIVATADINTLQYYNGKMYAAGERKHMGGGVDTSASATASIMSVENDGDYYSINTVDSTLYSFGSFTTINGADKYQGGIMRFEIKNKVDKSYAKVVNILEPCNQYHSRQMWTVITNLQNPTYIWYKDGNKHNPTSIPDIVITQLQSSAKIFCEVKAGTGCYTAQTINTDTVSFSNPAQFHSAKIIGPSITCSSLPSRYKAVATINNASFIWTFNNKKIEANGDELIFTPDMPGNLKVLYSAPDTGCYDIDYRWAFYDIKSLVTSITPEDTLLPDNLSHKCELDADTFTISSNMYFGSHQWSINGVNVGQDTNTLIVPAITKNDIVKCVISAATPNCFTAQQIADSVIANPQNNTTPTVSLSTNCFAGVCTITATTNFTSVKEYLWYKNGVYMGQGVNTDVYTYTPGVDIDTFICKAVPENGCYYPDTATSVNEVVIGINNIYASLDIYIYPNPITDFVIVNGIDKGDIIKVYDILSRTMLQAVATTGDIKLNLTALTTGVYMIEVSDKNGVRKSTHKLNKH